jgi:hypothetical protein
LNNLKTKTLLLITKNTLQLLSEGVTDNKQKSERSLAHSPAARPMLKKLEKIDSKVDRNKSANVTSVIAAASEGKIVQP